MPRCRSIVIHGHFYQPPREDPWLEEVEAELSAAPFHDWNRRIERECYRAVVAARITGAEGRIERVVNTLEWISFNYGPTLLEWMEGEAPETYAATIAADRASVARLGHGNAIAQPYHHAILPLSSRRDKITEVRWGIADFRRRFGRDPEGMWLPETAVDDETLDVLAAEGIRFTILAPHQVKQAPPSGHPGLYTTGNGRSIALCIYDGDISHGIAFGGLLRDAHLFAERLLSSGVRARAARTGEHEVVASERNTVPDERAVKPAPRIRDELVSAATDGETYGHHHKFGDMALVRALDEVSKQPMVRVENFASFLARHPAMHVVELVEPTSWSCAHGVERWRSNCGCRMDGVRFPSQAWRAPLREAIETLGEGLGNVYEREGARYFDDPWAARDAYGAAVGADPRTLERTARAIATRATSDEDHVRARELLELSRDALRIFTSCAWFFDDVGGLEPRQVMRYAAHAIELAGADGPALEAAFLEELSEARSNDPAVGTGRDVYEKKVRPKHPAPLRVAAAAAAATYELATDEIAAFITSRADHSAGSTRLPPAYAIAIQGEQVCLTRRRTGREHRVTARVVRATGNEIAVQVSRDDGAADDVRVLTLADFPEGPRHVIRAVLRSHLLPRCLTPAEMALLTSGEAPLRELVAAALTRTLARLTDDDWREALALAIDLTDLLQHLETSIPFDAQTVLWRVMQRVTDERREEVETLALRLGFAADVMR